MPITRSVAALLAMSILLGLSAWQPTGHPLANVALMSLGTRVTADTQFSDKFAGANAADGRIGQGEACWYSKDQTTLPCALTFELAQTEKLRKIVLHQAQWGGNMYHTKDFLLEASENGRTWRQIGMGQLADDNNATTTVNVNADTRWFRVVVVTSYNSFQTCGLAEVELLAERSVSLGVPELFLNGKPPAVSDESGGTTFAAVELGPQCLMDRRNGILAAMTPGETLSLTLPVSCTEGVFHVKSFCEVVGGGAVDVAERCDNASSTGMSPQIDVQPGEDKLVELRLTARSKAFVRISRLVVSRNGVEFPVSLRFDKTDYGAGAPPKTPNLRPEIQRAMIEADWMAQDGVGTERQPIGYPEAIAKVVKLGNVLAGELPVGRKSCAPSISRWREAAVEWKHDSTSQLDEARLRDLYLRLHWAKRELALSNPLVGCSPLVFAKQVPGCFSHQLTQYYGRYARPGGGIYVLDNPGVSMSVHPLPKTELPMGSYMYPEVSYGGDGVLFAYCQTDSTPSNHTMGEPSRFYHIYGVRSDGTRLKKITDGPFNDFAPRYLPNGKMVFISTRRGGWHRCGYPGCENYVLTVGNLDGTHLHPISFHETQEWDPAVLNDGRIVYTRWDYVDRHPVFYEHLWTTAPDGARAASLFGNNTFNPVGVWEARPVPGTNLVMATAAAHHAMTAGSVILVDPSKGVDGPAPVRRLTPDAPFPESETTVSGIWHAQMPGTNPYDTVENRRWPGQCYRTPYPLSSRLFYAAYSYRELIGEPNGNAANMFGLYLCDSNGNKELLYRDPNISSLWPIPLRPRQTPPALPSELDPRLADEGVFVLQNVYESLPNVPVGSVKALRIVQVLPKSTPGKDMPAIGLASGAPGKQVLGTVPVEADGSAHFRAPARRELAFQVLDANGMAVQVMRSGTYLQPGEKASCIGCHEKRDTAPRRTTIVALSRPPSIIAPGPDGSKPFSYPILVQSVLDRRCVSCHGGTKPAGGVSLVGTPEGHYSVSYNALVTRVPFSDMNNADALSKPNQFGARGSSLMRMLTAGHEGVKLTRDEIRRMATWMDVSALFYGTFDVEEQARQQKGERIAGAKLQ